MPDVKHNRLIHETSPYLLQHAHNPVDWYPYGEEALALAKTSNRPLLISIGYSACHWCHVMEHETFSRADIAERMNRDFVCIKVDREERPDVDQVFMAAVQLLHHSGGWPLNCFALPDGKPFWGGTYFRPDQWIELLDQISALFRRDLPELEKQAGRISDGIKGMSRIDVPVDKALPDMDFISETYNQLSLRFDTDYGGTIGAPKFPMPQVWEFVSVFHQMSGLNEPIGQFTLTLKKMAMGGIFDQLGGGFARYSTDIYWKVPHFEKMLYDNAQLASLYAHIFTLTGDLFFRDTLLKILSFIRMELTSEEGYFYSSLDADSEGEEGRFYLWTRAEIMELLPDYGELIADYFGLDKEGAWERGRNILLRPRTDAVFASQQHLSEEELVQLLKMVSVVLLEARNNRVRPALDHKLIVSWNALMIKALADTYLAVHHQESKDAAFKAAGYIVSEMMQSDGSLFRTKGKAGIPGFLDDYAFTIRAFISLYQLDFDEKWLYKARQLCIYVMDHFSDSDSPLFWFTPDSMESQSSLIRVKEVTDSVEPSGNAVMVEVLFQLGYYFDESNWIKHAESMLIAMKSRILAYPSAHACWAKVSAMFVNGITTIVLTGPQSKQYAEVLRRKAKAFTLFAAAESESDIPVFANRFKSGKNLIFICRGNVCDAPYDHPEDVIL